MNLFKWKIQPREDLWLHWNSCPINGFLCDKTNNFFLSATFRRRFSNKIHAFTWAIFLWKKNEIEFSTRIFIQSEHFLCDPKWSRYARISWFRVWKKNYLNYWSEQRKLWIKDSNRRRNIWNNTVCLSTARYPKQKRKKKPPIHSLRSIVCRRAYNWSTNQAEQVRKSLLLYLCHLDWSHKTRHLNCIWVLDAKAV